MFNWFRPQAKCPVKDHVKGWVDWRMDWLIRQFGRERLIDCETILPLADHFPADYDASREAVRAMFDQVCQYPDVDGERLELAYYSGGKGTAGVYDEREDHTVIWLETSNVNDPMSVVATLAHELCHFHLLGGRRIAPDEPDHEPLTDLAVIYFGFGVFAANASFRSRSYSYGQWHYTSMKRQGYLPPPVLGYGLALYAWLREETSPSWVRYVRADVCEPMRKALAYLGSSGAPALGLDGNPPLDPPELSQDLLERLGLPAVDGGEGDTQDGVGPERDHEGAASSSDEAFTDATIALNAGRYEEAASLFQKVVNDEPEDGEAYAQLAAVELKMSRPAEAVAAASKAIEISPDDGDALQIRGSAYLELGRCQDAVNDLESALATQYAAKRPDRIAATAHLLGKARARQRDYRQAIRDFSLAIKELPTWATPYQSRAEVYELLGEVEKAANDRDEATFRREAL